MDTYQKMSETKSALQASFRQLWNKAGRKGAAGAATGVGKTKPAIDEMMDLWDAYVFEKEPWQIETGKVLEPKKVFIAVPTEEMRDVNWPAEVELWYGKNGLLMWQESVTCVCYQSMHKYKSSDFDLVILDECHHITIASFDFFNSPVDVMALSATFPTKDREPDKLFLLNQVAPLVFTYPLDQGVQDGIIAPFEFHVVQIPLDNVHKNIEAGPKTKRYLTTEAARYNVLSNTIKKLYASKQTKAADMMVHKRRIFLCNLPSKLRVANALITKVCTVTDFMIPAGSDYKRTIVFCGSIAQANALFGENVYHSKAKGTRKRKSGLDRFRDKEINTLGVVSAVDEGLNIPEVDQAIIIQMDSNPRTLTQRVGRAVRWREGHTALIWILVTIGSQDQVWFEEAIKDFDQTKITYHSYTEFIQTL